MTSFVDLMLLARSECLLFTESGFSIAALWWGNHSCAMYGGEAVWRLGEQLRTALESKQEGEAAEQGGGQQQRHRLARRELAERVRAAGAGVSGVPGSTAAALLHSLDARRWGGAGSSGNDAATRQWLGALRRGWLRQQGG
jgi:hypothetical protein